MKFREQMAKSAGDRQQRIAAANDGNISLRLGDDRVLCSPIWRSKGFMKPDDLSSTSTASRSPQSRSAERDPAPDDHEARRTSCRPLLSLTRPPSSPWRELIPGRFA
jgi:hypothetical protein